ncbi:hypothetical protein [Candidatus Amarobacter glycogenicus]|uniref:hypothetical protein n=1 Tax=Candidatus Amarobacter glycogenicus TaxID=3140699 RepID=UPI003136257D|nr:hypothetical protein [Dehalococcoidia bacterium]
MAQASTCPEGALVKKHAVVSTSNGSSYCYDQNGNMRRRTIGGNTYTLTYDDENRLVSISGAATANYTYDADGARIKSVMNGETVTTIGNLYEKKVAGGATTHTKYYYFNGQRVAVRVAGVVLAVARSPGQHDGDGQWRQRWRRRSLVQAVGESRGRPSARRRRTQRRFTGRVLDEGGWRVVFLLRDTTTRRWRGLH